MKKVANMIWKTYFIVETIDDMVDCFSLKTNTVSITQKDLFLMQISIMLNQPIK